MGWGHQHGASLTCKPKKIRTILSRGQRISPLSPSCRLEPKWLRNTHTHNTHTHSDLKAEAEVERAHEEVTQEDRLLGGRNDFLKAVFVADVYISIPSTGGGYSIIKAAVPDPGEIEASDPK